MKTINSEPFGPELSRRLSQSAPALTTLDRLVSATEELDRCVSSLGVAIQISSESFSAPSSPTFAMSDSGKKGTCHACHAPLAIHSSLPSGLARCPLPHWEECPGGIDGGKAANGSEWRGCPIDFEPKQLAISVHSSHSSSPGQDDDVFNDCLEKKDTDSKESKDQGTENKELEELQARNILLKEQLARHQAQKLEQEQRENARLVQLMEEENQRLVEEMGGDTGGARSRQPKSLPRVSSAHPGQPAPSSVSWHSSYQQHLTRNQMKSSQRATEGPPVYTGLDITGIRKIPALKKQVESLVEHVQDSVPSLDKRPTANLTGRTELPDARPTFTHHANPEYAGQLEETATGTADGGYLYLRRRDGTLYKVQVIDEDAVIDISPKSRSYRHMRTNPSRASASSSHEDPLVSSDEDCPLVPRPGYRHVWRQSKEGEKYFTEEPIPSRSNLEYKWIKDARTGRTTKKLVQAETGSHLEMRTVIDPHTGCEVDMLVPRSPSMNMAKSGQSRSNVQKEHRPRQVSTRPAWEQNSSLNLGPSEDKQGKDGRTPTIVQYARSCPVAWTSKVTSDKLNMGLWCWSYVAELLARRTGAAPPLAQGELEARLQHFLNVLEISLQPSNPSEYDSHAWRVARLYGEKVQQKVDKGTSWTVFEQRYGADSHPHELMAAQLELAPKPGKPKDPKDPKDLKLGKDKEKRRTCTTWNISEVENKCKFEVEYEGRVCDRKHECSWCKDKHKKSLPHQRSFCRQRINAGEQ